MPELPELSRRNLLALAGTTGIASLVAGQTAAAAQPPDKVFRIGVVSAAIRGKPQERNGHTWNFAHYLHPTIDFDKLQKLYLYGYDSYKRVYRNPKYNFGLVPFADTRITHYYDADPTVGAAFTEVFPGIQVATSLEQMAQEVDAVWIGDASGFGEDHFDLAAPGLAKGLPTFCDKPIGGSVAQTRKILEFARAHKAPLMSSSLFRHQWGMEAALRKRDTNEFGPITHITASMPDGFSVDRWLVYGHHPVWSIMTLMGPGVEAVNVYQFQDNCHAMITWPDKHPCRVYYGEPFEKFEYDRTHVYFKNKHYEFTPSIEGNFEYGHHYEMFRMAATFREMIRTGIEPVPHQEILEVTAILHAGVKSLNEGSRFVKLEEVM